MVFLSLDLVGTRFDGFVSCLARELIRPKNAEIEIGPSRARQVTVIRPLHRPFEKKCGRHGSWRWGKTLGRESG